MATVNSQTEEEGIGQIT